MTNTIDYKGHQINIDHDDNTESPREWDNLGTMYCNHSRYNLGDEKIPDYYINSGGDSIDIDSVESFTAWRKNEGDNIAIILPLGLYDHSGITMYIGSSHDRWDGGQVGWIVVTKEQLRKEYSVKRITKSILTKAEAVLRGEVKTFDTYLRGEVVGYSVEGDLCDDSCWGFYEEADAIAQAKDAIDYTVEQARKERLAKLKSYIGAGVPLQYRFI